MSRRDELNSYIARLQQRLRLGAWLRGAALFTGTALIVTVALVLLLNHLAFPSQGVAGARLALFAALAATAVLGIALPLIHLTRTHAVSQTEAAYPEFDQRLTTFHERERNGSDPFLELLAADTLSQARNAELSSLVPNNRLFALSGAGLACLGVLVWTIAAGPGYLGYGASLLWTGPKKDATPFYSIVVTPGDVAVRRNADQLITARVLGMKPEKAQIFAHYQSTTAWEPVTMQAQPDAGGAATYQFAFAGLPENVEYYVAAGPLVSPHYKVRVVDLPAVKGIRVTYQYPKWTGLKPITEEHTGDLRAIEGTDAAIEIEMDHPLKNGQLTLDDGHAIQLKDGSGNKYQGTIHMTKDGAYHLAATDEGQSVRLSEDYFIAAEQATPPEVAISRPGGDYRASPIEEVTVGVKAADQFGLNDVHLHYSVNGGPDRDVSLLKAPGEKNADGSYTLPLEDFKLVPGDLVSLYATAKDGHAESRTDITFIQADPFEREFSQSQQMGGGGGGGGGQNNQIEISKREKELIAATWKQQNDKSATPKDSAAQGQFLSEAQQKLRDQVMALSARMESRDLSEANEEFNGFEKDMQTAAAAMAPSADKLKATQWKDAIPLEQKALQALLHAEATFRKIEVAFGQQGGGGGGVNSAGRDLASLFDLELDTEKNQYETAQSTSPAEQHQKDVEDALAKLDALARRQQDLANQQQNPQQNFQERWQQEMLRREAEQLQRQLEQLAQNNRGQQQNGQQGSSGASSSGQSGSQQQSASSQNGSQTSRQQQQASGQSGSQGSSQSPSQSSDQRIEQALSRLRQAGEAMKRSGSPQQGTDAARQAADQLREAANLLGGTQQQMASGKLNSLSHEADRLTQEERAQSDRINKLTGQQRDDDATDDAANSQMDRDRMMEQLRQRNQLAGERQQLSDDLSKLQRNLRDTAREVAPNQPGVSQKLRDALAEMDQSDLDNHMQRTADWLRSGINPNTNGTETEIAQGLQKLSQQLRQAQQAMGQEKPGQGQEKARQNSGAAPGDETAMLNQVERLRSQLEAMSGGQQQSQNGQRGGRDPNGQPYSRGQEQRAGGQSGQRQQGRLQREGSSGEPTRNQSGPSGDVRYGSGTAADGAVLGNINTGDNRYGQGIHHDIPMDASGNPADNERFYQQGVRELNQLRQMVQNDPQAAKEVQDLARQMQRLDPKRFPGNPEIVEQMHRDVLSSLDRIELQLQRDDASTQARTGKPFSIPDGYQDSVAEYYKRLSKNP
ncbi:hypothetical protein H7849_20505 [Alloacidobacterium dinghuense]|uniref:DUF4175 family protein n=1 Tax=Alloacidobacterium dinghuense TaxID=2763107 RepID=A0A7G8BFW3_9BACT|nr:DUF4175 family protein [Alloacidobacterium dinghuense]QNI31433.1 hypothetical protein H7849_20505 [Alloacidobacterium dinghuense]